MKLVLPEEVRTTCRHGWNAMLSWKSRQNRSSFLLLFSSFLTSIWCPCWQNLTGSHLAKVRYLLSLSPHITRQNLGSRSCKSTTPLATPQPPYTLFYAYCYFHAAATLFFHWEDVTILYAERGLTFPPQEGEKQSPNGHHYQSLCNSFYEKSMNSFSNLVTGLLNIL